MGLGATQKHSVAMVNVKPSLHAGNMAKVACIKHFNSTNSMKSHHLAMNPFTTTTTSTTTKTTTTIITTTTTTTTTTTIPTTTKPRKIKFYYYMSGYEYLTSWLFHFRTNFPKIIYSLVYVSKLLYHMNLKLILFCILLVACNSNIDSCDPNDNSCSNGFPGSLLL